VSSIGCSARIMDGEAKEDAEVGEEVAMMCRRRYKFSLFLSLSPYTLSPSLPPFSSNFFFFPPLFSQFPLSLSLS
jgi:hypothetical protein